MSATPTPPARRFRRPLLLAVLVVGVVGFLGYRYFRPAPPAPPDPKAEALEPAVLAAVHTARERVLREPKSAKAWGELGEVFFANEMEDEARVCFAEAARLDRKSSRWPYLEGAILVNRGDREGALPYLRRAVELAGDRDEENPGPRFTLAESLLLLGRAEEAEPYIRRILARKPDDPRGQFDAGLQAVASGDWEGARGHLLKCLDSPYTRQKSRVQLAAICRRLGDLSRADEFQSEASRMPADADWADPVIDECFRRTVKKRAAFKLAEGLESQGRFAEALRAVLPVAEEYPDDDVAQSLSGRLFAQVGELTHAERALRRACQLAPQKVQHHYLLSLVLTQEGQKRKQSGDKNRAAELFREAVSQAREAVALKGDFGFAHMSLGLALNELGQKAEARAALAEAVKCSPEYAEIHLRLAELLDESGAVAEARERYQQALELAAPGTPWRARVEARLAELKKNPKPGK